jgi:hypothetical protein
MSDRTHDHGANGERGEDRDARHGAAAKNESH